MRTKINKIGVEIEGEFLAESLKKLEKYGTVKSDNSLHPCNDCQEKNYECWEFASNPYERHEIGKLTRLIRSLNDYHFNDSCGFHVHVSFKPRVAPEIISVGFYEFFIARLIKHYPKVWSTRKNNTYCRAIGSNLEYYIALNGARRKYQPINFGHAYKNHKTIEFRIFPANTPEKMTKYLVFIVRTIELYLKHPETEKISFGVNPDNSFWNYDQVIKVIPENLILEI